VLLEHPLIRLASELYPAQPLECDAVLTFHRSDWSEPGFFGQSLAQIAYFSNFAIWISWVEESQ
jgi:hypothetical protein